MKELMVYTPYIDTRKCVIYGYDAYEEMTCNDFLLQNFIGKPLPLTWKLPKYTAEYTNFSLNDFLHGHIQAPFVSAHAQKKLAPILKGQAEFRSIGKIRGEDYYVMNVIIGGVNPYIFAFFIHLPISCAPSGDAHAFFMARCNRAFAVL